jgi:hypothetical protein
MKSVFATSLATFLLVSCAQKSESEYKNYGPIAVDSTKAISVDDMLLTLEQNPAADTFTFYAPIEEVCQAAGCWVNVKKTNGDYLRVRFKDHFLIPPHSKIGEIAYFHGAAYWDTVSVELQKHFLEDAGKSQAEIDKITSPSFELNFEADGVLVKKTNVNSNKKK